MSEIILSLTKFINDPANKPVIIAPALSNNKGSFIINGNLSGTTLE